MLCIFYSSHHFIHIHIYIYIYIHTHTHTHTHPNYKYRYSRFRYAKLSAAERVNRQPKAGLFSTNPHMTCPWLNNIGLVSVRSNAPSWRHQHTLVACACKHGRKLTFACMTGLEGSMRCKHKVDAVIVTDALTLRECWVEPSVDDFCFLSTYHQLNRPDRQYTGKWRH